MIGTLKTDSKGAITETISTYKPPQEVRDLTVKVQRDYQVAFDIQNRPFREFNDMSLLQRMDADQKAFNSYVPPKNVGNNESWRWNGVRPITRNKVISMAAHYVASIPYPRFFAQNEQNEEDKGMAEVMDMAVEWNIRNSDYELSFLYAIISALVNPITYFNPEFSEVGQKIKKKDSDGKIKKVDIRDEVLSGFHLNVVPGDEVLITNAHQFYLQRQRVIFRRRYLDFDTAQAFHGDHQNWQYIRPGIKTIFDKATNLFYEQIIENSPTLVEELTYYNRGDDTEIKFVNGIYLGDFDVDNNLIKSRDNADRPYYPYIPIGFEPIDGKRFFAFKSQVAKMADDQELYDRVWQMLMDGTFLEVMTPLLISGGEKVDSNVMFPGGVTQVSRELQVNELGKGRNLVSAYNAMSSIEKSISESSQFDQRAGQQGARAQTAREALLIEQNAKIQLGIFGRVILEAIRQLGQMMANGVIHTQSIGELEEILGGTPRLQYKTLIMPDKIEKGRKISKKIVFDPTLIGKMMNKKDRIWEGYKMMKDNFDKTTKIYRVNPPLFAKRQYSVITSVDQLLPKNEFFERALKLEAHARMIQSPFADREAVDRDFLFEPLARGESDKYMTKANPNAMMPQDALKQQTPAPIPGAETALREAAMQGILG